MTNQTQNSNVKYGLAERTALFGEQIISFVQSFSHTPINKPLISHVIRSGTSTGANYMEAGCAKSKKDFCHKFALCKKEAKKICHWLRMLAKANSDQAHKYRRLWQEAHELLLIFPSIHHSTKD